ncbi:hypothetical protein B0T21DRAFT_295859 [Apiosordaria backusii]|uniref:Uncharacterized protein n=1 Tax=Apiosordaria backusii TaxID=314023 RepID=A0AA40ANQ0_9PEZI|nr:hypothetical protein B0T21DRAFT_295859 [Apiosordaria backusii]
MVFSIHQAEPAWSGFLYHLEQAPGPLHSTSEAIAFIILLFFPFLVHFYVGLFVQHRLHLCHEGARQKQYSSATVTRRYHGR